MPDSGSHDHLSDEQLLLFADGESPPRRATAVRRHLESCWSCRARMQQLQFSIARFADLRKKTDTVVPPKGWREFDMRLTQAEIQANRQGGWWRNLRSSLFAPSFPRLKLAAALAVFCCLILVYRSVNAPTVLAKELCERAEAAERAMLASDQLLRQRLQVRTSGDGLDRPIAETVETWRRASGERMQRAGVQPLPERIDRVLEANNMAGMSPLSAHSFSIWRDSIRPVGEAVTRSWRPGEGQVYEIRTRANSPSDPWRIREGRLTVRAADWLPLALAWTVNGPSGDQLIEITSLEAEPMEADRLAWLLANRTSSEPASMAVAGPEPPPPPKLGATPLPDATSADLETLEIDASYALHRMGLCYGGGIEIDRQGDQVLVRGIVPTAEDLQSLNDLLPDVPQLTVQVRSIEELDSTIPTSLADGPPAIVTTSGSTTPRLEKQLRDYFTGNGDDTGVGQQVTSYLYQVVRLSHTLRREAWALRRLTERYGDTDTSTLAFASQRRLETMISDHTLQLRGQVSRSQQVLEPVLSWCIERMPADSGWELPEIGQAIPPDRKSWSAQTLDLVTRTERFNQLIRGVFVDAHTDRPPLPSAIRELSAILEQLDADSSLAVSTVEEHFLLPFTRFSQASGIE